MGLFPKWCQGVGQFTISITRNIDMCSYCLVVVSNIVSCLTLLRRVFCPCCCCCRFSLVLRVSRSCVELRNQSPWDLVSESWSQTSCWRFFWPRSLVFRHLSLSWETCLTRVCWWVCCPAVILVSESSCPGWKFSCRNYRSHSQHWSEHSYPGSSQTSLLSKQYQLKQQFNDKHRKSHSENNN